MAVKTRKKCANQPPKVLTEAEREKLRQKVLDWHTATTATLATLAHIASEMLQELSKCCSPLDEFFGQVEDLEDFIGHINDADGSMTFVLARESLTPNTSIPNPCDLLRGNDD